MQSEKYRAHQSEKNKKTVAQSFDFILIFTTFVFSFFIFNEYPYIYLKLIIFVKKIKLYDVNRFYI